MNRIAAAAMLLITTVLIAGSQGDTLFGYVPRTYTAQNTSEQTMPYRLHIPGVYDAANRYPLVLFLHGAGEWGSDNRLQITNDIWNNQCCLVQLLSSDDVQSAHPCFVVAPQSPEGEKWVDADWTSGSYTGIAESDEMRSAIAILASLCSEFAIDSSRIYVAGLSMGGFGVWDAIGRYPELFAAAIPICGGADTAASVVAQIKSLPIWTFHGDSDEDVPVSGTREIVAALKSLESPVTYTEIAGGDHLIWPSVCATSTLIDWLFSHSRTPGTTILRPAPRSTGAMTGAAVWLLNDVMGRTLGPDRRPDVYAPGVRIATQRGTVSRARKPVIMWRP